MTSRGGMGVRVGVRLKRERIYVYIYLIRSPGVGNGNPLQYSYLRNSMKRGAWQATVYGVAKGQTGLSIAELIQVRN